MRAKTWIILFMLLTGVLLIILANTVWPLLWLSLAGIIIVIFAIIGGAAEDPYYEEDESVEIHVYGKNVKLFVDDEGDEDD